MIMPIQFRECVVIEPLKRVDLWSVNSEEIVFSTGAQESKCGTYIIQQTNAGIFRNGGLGPFQMETLTYNDMWDRFIKPGLRKTILEACNFAEKPPATEMVTNLAFAAIMCRIKYLSIPHELPPANDVNAMAAYWKQWYNTPGGAGTVEEFIHNYHILNTYTGVK